MRVQPASPACFPCGEIPRYRKKSQKTPPKKADHKHEYEPVIFRYFNKYSWFSRERGFTGDYDYAAGQRCTVCGRLEHGFPDGSHGPVAATVNIPWQDGTTRKRRIIIGAFTHLPIVSVQDYWKLKEVTSND